MDTLALDSVVGDELVLLSSILRGSEALALQLCQLRGNVWEDEEGGILCTLRKHLNTLIGKGDAIHLLIDDEVERIGDDVHLAHVLRHIDLLGLEHRGFDAWLTEVLDERLVLR